MHVNIRYYHLLGYEGDIDMRKMITEKMSRSRMVVKNIYVLWRGQ